MRENKLVYYIREIMVQGREVTGRLLSKRSFLTSILEKECWKENMYDDIKKDRKEDKESFFRNKYELNKKYTIDIRYMEKQSRRVRCSDGKEGEERKRYK